MLSKYLVLIALGLILSSCASEEISKVNKHNSGQFRIAVDPVGLNDDQIARLDHSLVSSGQWIVVNRGSGFEAVKREQNMVHKEDADRFEDKERYAHWGKLYGVGAIIVANSQCQRAAHFIGGYFLQCRHTLELLSAVSGEVLATSEAIEDGEDGFDMQPTWNKSVAALNSSLPSTFEHREDYELLQYKNESRVNSIEYRKKIAEERDAKSKRKPVQDLEEE